VPKGLVEVRSSETPPVKFNAVNEEDWSSVSRRRRRYMKKHKQIENEGIADRWGSSIKTKTATATRFASDRRRAP